MHFAAPSTTLNKANISGLGRALAASSMMANARNWLALEFVVSTHLEPAMKFAWRLIVQLVIPSKLAASIVQALSMETFEAVLRPPGAQQLTAATPFGVDKDGGSLSGGVRCAQTSG